ncbi:MAG: helix-turn-helix domain-containing protein [Clostridia bacterium]|nr:helix-turn-helix domain-containing protein [Clostridia bacterium]
MFYHCENPVIELIGVEQLCWQASVVDVAPRGHAALAFRIRGTALIDGRYIGTGDLLYLPQGMGYHAEYTDTEMLVFHFVTARADRKPEIYPLANTEEIYKAFSRARRLWKNREPGYQANILALLYQILGQLCAEETESRLPAHFTAAVSALNTHFRDGSLSISGICRQAGLGETAFRQLFKTHYRKTPVEYLTQLRLEYARGLIAAGCPVETAASESGFNDPKYFARVVRRVYDCSPKEWKTYGK